MIGRFGFGLCLIKEGLGALSVSIVVAETAGSSDMLDQKTYNSMSSFHSIDQTVDVEELRMAIAAQHLNMRGTSRRRYFDSGDYAMAKILGDRMMASSHSSLSSQPLPIKVPKPEDIPHKSLSGSLGSCTKSSPIREKMATDDDEMCTNGNQD